MNRLLQITTCILLAMVCVPSMNAEQVDSISQYGVTWQFDKAYPAGQFVTGDWWVIGPVTIVSVSPLPGPVDVDAYSARKNQFGDTILKADLRMRNGSVIFTGTAKEQGYDSRIGNYNGQLSQAYPLVLGPNQSLVSTVSHELPGGQNLVHPIMWDSEKKTACLLKSAAILTCLATPPPTDAFRPCFVGAQKKMYQAKDLRWELLQELEPTAGQPAWSDLERWFERPWLDNMGSWTIQSIGPSENNPIYGREISRITGLAGLALNCRGTREEKRKTMLGLVQYGIDIHGFIENGLNYLADGGHYSGRKFPVIFAGLMLGEESFYTFAPEMCFQEDQDTYYGEGWCGQTVLFQMTTHHGPRRSYEEIDPGQWDEFDKRSEGYRVCCNGKAWIATALTMHLMRGIQTWNHDAFFDYCDRWMQKEDPYAARRGKHPRPRQEGSAFDDFATLMWEKYRTAAPPQAPAGNPRKWQWTMDGGQAKAPGKWIPNPLQLQEALQEQ